MNVRIQSYPTREDTSCDYCGETIPRSAEAYYLADGPFLLYCSETCTLEDDSERNAAQADYPPAHATFEYVE